MNSTQRFPPTIILRHIRENLKKCSLRGLEEVEGFTFYTYPMVELPDLSDYLLLALEGAPLTQNDTSKGLLILDGTWRYAEKMMRFVEGKCSIEKRSIPKGFQTAYPRRQDDCSDPGSGLASIEAIYIAYRILGRPVEGILDHYYWKEQFIKLNEKNW
jgi:pre-rRNA-processing protein TSR3